MSERLLGWFGVGTFGALWAVCLIREAPRIEAELLAQGSEAINVAGLPSNGLIIDGRALTWRGVVDGAEDIVRVGDLLAEMAGVRSVRVDGIRRPPPKAKTLERRLAQLVEHHPITFTSNSAVLVSRSRESLDVMADVMAGEPDMSILIEGHTDSRGDPRMNLELSQQRADAVRRYLVLRGIAPDRLEAIGFGDTAPIADNASAAGRRANRRIVFRVKE